MERQPLNIPRFKYEIGDKVYQYTTEDDYEIATITKRQMINGHPCYMTDLREKWEHENFLK